MHQLPERHCANAARDGDRNILLVRSMTWAFHNRAFAVGIYGVTTHSAAAA